MKYVKAREISKKKDSIQELRIASQDSIIKTQSEIISRYENNVIPNLNDQVDILTYQNDLLTQKLTSQQELFDVRLDQSQLKIDKLKAKRLGIGFSAGYGFTPEGSMPSVNLSLNYTLFRL